MAWELPPLSALRVFEAVARLGSFTKAADELGMTQAAASYQIKVLEERAGTPLFIRKARQISLTEAGSRLAPQASKAFAEVADAWLSAKGGAAGVLSITTIQSFASNWLAVNLGAFQLMHPELAVKVDTSHRVVDLQKEEFDLGIRTGRGHWPGLKAHFLFKADYTPMLSPRLAEKVGGIRTPEDLYKVPLFSTDDPWWENWFRAAGGTFDRKRTIPVPTMGSQAYDAMAAIADQGAAILTRNLYSTLLGNRQLYQPFETMGSDGDGYWLVYVEGRHSVPKIKAFRDWILKQTVDLRSEAQGERRT